MGKKESCDHINRTKCSALTVWSFCRGIFVWSGLVQLAVVWCAGVPAVESPVGAVYLPAHGAVTTSLQCCVNFIGCGSRDEWSLRLRVSYTNRSLQQLQRTCLLTFDSSPSMVVLISVHPLTEPVSYTHLPSPRD